MWAAWVVLAGAVVILPGAVISDRRRAAARALIGDLEAALDLFDVGHGEDRYTWVPVLVDRNVPWDSPEQKVAVAREHEGAVEVRHGLGGYQQQSRLPEEGWYRRFSSPSEVVMLFHRTRCKQTYEGPSGMTMLLRPEQIRMLPNVPKRWSPFGERSRELEVRRMLVGVGLASWFDVAVSTGDVCVPAVARGVDGPESARMVVRSGDALIVWGRGATFYGSFSLDRSAFRRRVGHVRLDPVPPLPADGGRPGTETVLRLRPEHALAIRCTGSP